MFFETKCVFSLVVVSHTHQLETFLDEKFNCKRYVGVNMNTNSTYLIQAGVNEVMKVDFY